MRRLRNPMYSLVYRLSSLRVRITKSGSFAFNFFAWPSDEGEDQPP